MPDHTTHSRDPDAIERDLNATRARLDTRLRELGERFSPGQLLDEALDYMRNNQGVDFTRRLANSVRERPIPVALAGVGIAWLMAAGPRPPERVVYRHGTANRGPYRSDLGPDAAGTASGTDDLADRVWAGGLAGRAWKAGKAITRNEGESDADYRGRVTEARATVLGIAREANDTAHNFAERVEEALFAARDRVSDTAQGLADQAGSQWQSWRDTASNMSGRMSDAASGTYAQARNTLSHGPDLFTTISGNPVLLGSLGMLAGAVVGALFPPTETERRYLGDTAQQARDTVTDTAQTVMEQGREVANTAAQSAAEGARKALDAGRETAAGNMAQAAADATQSTPPDRESEASQAAREGAGGAVNATTEAARHGLQPNRG